MIRRLIKSRLCLEEGLAFYFQLRGERSPV